MSNGCEHVLRRVFVGMLLTIAALPHAPVVAAAEEGWTLVGGATEVSRVQPVCLACPADMQPTWDLSGGPGALTSTVTGLYIEQTHPSSVSIGWSAPLVLIPFDDLGSLASPGPNDGYLVVDPVIGFAGGAPGGTGEYSVASITAFLQVLQEAPAPGTYGNGVGAILLADGSVVTSAPHDVQVPSYTAGTGSGTYSTKMWLEVTVKHEGAEIIYQYEYEWVALQPTPTAEATPVPEATLEDVRVDSGVELLELQGEVEINIPLPDGTYDEENWLYARLEKGKSFPAGTHIKTGPDSSAIVSSADLQTFVIGPESEFELLPPIEQASVLQVFWGHFKANVNRLLSGQTLEIRTHQAVTGVKGTILVIEESDAGTTLKVLDGTVTFTSKTDGSAILVGAGEMATATSAGLSEKTAFDVTAEQAEWQGLEDATDASSPGTEDGGASLLVVVLAAIAVALVGLIVVALVSIARQIRNSRRKAGRSS